MKIEICIQCIDDGRVPKHQIITWECKGNMSRDARMRQVGNAIARTLRQEFPKRQGSGGQGEV